MIPLTISLIMFFIVSSGGFEPPTSALRERYSSQLSYEPALVNPLGIEPRTYALKERCSTVELGILLTNSVG